MAHYSLDRDFSVLKLFKSDLLEISDLHRTILVELLTLWKAVYSDLM
jgi:hypothetical protein